jgi:hypothetical protein
VKKRLKNEKNRKIAHIKDEKLIEGVELKVEYKNQC